MKSLALGIDDIGTDDHTAAVSASCDLDWQFLTHHLTVIPSLLVSSIQQQVVHHYDAELLREGRPISRRG